MNWIVPYLALTAGQGFDAVSTARALDSGRCVERNRAVYGETPSPVRLIATKAAAVGSLGVTMWVLKKAGHPTAARRLGYLGGSIGAVAGAWNLHACS